MKKNIVVIDPAKKRPAIEAWNKMVKKWNAPITFHLPALYKTESLNDEVIADIKAVIILGSVTSVNDNLPWQNELCDWLDKVFTHGEIPVLGICFGHQLIAKHLGGKVEKLKNNIQYNKLRHIEISATHPFSKRSGVITVSHGEEVTLKPKDMDIFASSEDINIEALKHRTLPIWTFQSHPEATFPFIETHKIPCSLKELNQTIGWDVMNDFSKVLKLHL